MRPGETELLVALLMALCREVPGGSTTIDVLFELLDVFLVSPEMPLAQAKALRYSLCPLQLTSL